MRRRALLLAVVALVGCDRINSFLDMGTERVVLSNEPLLLDKKPIRLADKGPLNVIGYDTEVCFDLAKDVPQKVDEDALFEKALGGARLSAVLHGTDGKEYTWHCAGWAVGGKPGENMMSACMRMECNEPSPPKGSKISWIDVSSDRPLRVLDAEWNSTSAFDGSAQASPQYLILEKSFGGKPAWKTPAHPVLRVQLGTNADRESSAYQSSLQLRITPKAIQLEPGPAAAGLDIVNIPAEAVGACGGSSYGARSRSVHLLIPREGVEIELLRERDMVDWCFDNRLPMLSGEQRENWRYNRAPLPPKEGFSAQFVSRDAYHEAAIRAFNGY
jgi:hypothetical protein